jgi:hypothetical protein
MCHIQKSQNAIVAFVFICPGKHEKAANHPCAGVTGKNLDKAIQELSIIKNNIFSSNNRVDYVITNAWDKVEYKSLTQRSVPTHFEVSQDNNLKRLASELQGVSYVIACGEHAKLAVYLCSIHYSLKVKIAYANHLSQRAINSLGSTNMVRINNWAMQVANQI